MARLDHVAIWTEDVERLASFYCEYFHAQVGDRYVNPDKGFESRFVTFDDGTRLEIMRTTFIRPVRNPTNRLRAEGYPVVDGPRRTGDGYYESVVLDPDGNRVEITA